MSRAQTLLDVAMQLGLSIERVRQIECAALAKLRPVCQALDLHPGDFPYRESALARAADMGDDTEDEERRMRRRLLRRSHQRERRARKKLVP